jgi:hypothetical protein
VGSSCTCALYRSFVARFNCGQLRTVVAGSASGGTTRRVSDTHATGAVNKPLCGATESVCGTVDSGAVRSAGKSQSILGITTSYANLRRASPFLHSASLERDACADYAVHITASFTAAIY